MKKVFIFAAIAICAAAFAVSCDKNSIEVNNLPAGKSNVFTCSLPENTPDSKYSIAENGKVSWEVGDEIMIHGGKDGSARLLVTLTADDIISEKKAVIDLGDFEPYIHSDTGADWGYYAQYPASLVPDGNMYYECCFQGTDAPLMAACSIDNTFSFKNLCGIISYTVSGDFDKVVFSGNNKETVAFDYYQVRVRKDLAEPNYHKPGNGFPEYNEFKSIEKDVVADGSTVNYIYLPKGVNFGGGFTFKFYKSGELVKIATTETAANVAHGKLLPLGNITSRLADYVAPQTSDHTSTITGATDLSTADGPANCYVITAPGAYKLPVVRGNDPADVPGTAFGVELLWETYNNSEDVVENSVIAKVDYDGPSNYVFFETPATLKPGNALIAAKNSEDKIIWSWHIWIPATAIETNTYGIYDHALMDRYLGALVAATTTSVPVESFGLHYQWGRKDPFLGAGAITGSDFATRSGTALSRGYEMTVAQTIANPTAYAVYTEADSWGNWLNPYDASLWKEGEKTVYDPCPPGYRIPKRNTSQPLHASDLSTVTGWSDNAAAGDNAAFFTLGSPVTVFPFGGLVCENGKYVDYNGGRSFIWTSSANSEGNGRMVDVRQGTTTHKITTTVTARGCSVRCVVEE